MQNPAQFGARLGRVTEDRNAENGVSEVPDLRNKLERPGDDHKVPASPHRCGDRRRLSCCAGLLLPAWNVHAHHEEPQAQRYLPNAGENQNVGLQRSSERW
jgi:hypothetical protein